MNNNNNYPPHNARWEALHQAERQQHTSNMAHVRQHYQMLLEEYKKQQLSIANIDELYRRFKLLKKYEAEYDRNQELKKELNYWDQNRTEKEIYLENEVSKLNSTLFEANQKMKMFKLEQDKDLEKIQQLKKELNY